MNTLEIDTLLKKHPHSRPVFKGVCQKQITQIIKRTFGPCGKYGSRPSNGTTLDRYIHRRQLTRGILRSNRTSTARICLCQFHEQTLPSLDLQYVRVQEKESTVCGFRCIVYLIHRCAGHSMTDVTRLLENTVCCYLLSMCYEKKKKKKEG
jgi:hypothetical protein